MKIFHFKNDFINDWLEVLLEAVIIAVVLYIIFWPMKIDGRSMNDTLHTGDRVIISRLLVFLNKIESGDIIVCKIDINGNDKDIIKRLIGLPGDRIVIEDGNIFINNILISEPYVIGGFNNYSIDFILGEDEYFVLGDNRDLSYDSRQLGPIKKDDILAKVIVKFFPLNEIKTY